MSEKEQELHAKIAEMEGDIRTTVSTFLKIMNMFGIKQSDLSSEDGDIIRKIPGILSKVTMQFATGSIDTQSFADLKAITPVMEKYKYLVEDFLKTE